ncbi:MAG TPA: cell envelope integrity EipB family protein [Xanthobacteraceae bacterium]|nr:cell envelope integrity EipB family protein [Xanthobacteraceae bacterium]
MLRTVTPTRSALASMAFAAAIAALGLFTPSPVAAQNTPITLVPHRAVYELKLSQTRGRRPMRAVHGSIFYDFSGNACDGYDLVFRQTSELDNGEGNPIVSDTRVTSKEGGKANSLSFESQTYLNNQPQDQVSGFAQRSADGLGVNLTKPWSKTFDLAPNLVFPTEHILRIIAAAREGKSFLQAAVYDGSETGEKVYDTLAVIGPAIAPNEKRPTDAAAKQPSLAKLTRWRVTISYFDKAEKNIDQTPTYTVSFELYENGISRALVLDYNDFILSGEMTSLDIKTSKPCALTGP